MEIRNAFSGNTFSRAFRFSKNWVKNLPGPENKNRFEKMEFLSFGQ